MFSALILLLAPLAYAGIQQGDFSGIGHIRVLESEDWRHATPNDTVGCLNAHGRFILESEDGCGVFARLPDSPYTLSTQHGNCTFTDTTQEENKDSKYGRGDYAWTCEEYKGDIYDGLYTITGFPYVFLCFGDVACYYDAKHKPSADEALSLWPFRWGSEQMGITPGHIMLQLLWEKIGDLPKRDGASEIPGPRVRVDAGMQEPLLGGMVRA